jgi:putative transposase
MKLTAQVKLHPTAEQAQLLQQTLEKANAACNHISRRAWESKTFNQYRRHKLTYAETRKMFPLTAQVVVRCISKVADGYKLDRKRRRKFAPHGGLAYDSRILNWRMAARAVSIWCLGGRQQIPFAAGPRQLELLAQQHGESDLVLVEDSWFLFATCAVEEPVAADVSDVLGVDLGVTNLAADSDGNVYSSAEVNGLRRRHRHERQTLQAKGTQDARRRLKKRRRKETRFARNINHTISKRIVVMAQGTGRGIALEELSGIRDRITARKSQRAALHSWSFFQLRSFVSYKAQRAGVPVSFVNPRNTSRTCPQCGGIDKANRKSQSIFSCVSCGHSGLADTIAAENIRRAACRPAILPAPAKTSAGMAGESLTVLQ